MKCKIDIEKGIIKKAINSHIRPTIKKVTENTLFITNKDYNGNSYQPAENLKNTINKEFDSELAFRIPKTDGQEVKIQPNSKLVDEYYESYIKKWNELNTVLTGVDEFGDSDTNIRDLYNRAFNLSQEQIEERIKQCE